MFHLFFAKLTVLEIRLVINSATFQQGIVNATRAMCSHLAPYEEECRYGKPVLYQLLAGE